MADKKDKKEADEDLENDAEGDAEAGDAVNPDAAKKKKKKILIIAAVAILLLGGGGAGLYFAGMLPFSAKTDVTTGKKVKKKKTEEGEHGTTGSSVKSVKQNLNDWIPGPVPGHEGDDVAYYNLPEFLVNLNTSSKQTSFVKMKITLETTGEGDMDAIDSRMPRITDNFNTYLRELRTSDLNGSAGLYRLREELLLRVNKTIYPNKVNDILFREIIIQ